MKRSNKLYEGARVEVVRQALSGIKTAVLARQYNLSQSTISQWVRTYRDQVDTNDLPPADHQIAELKRLQEMEEKYEKAVKVIGEKELEIEILRELVKKSNPAYATKMK